MRGSFLFITALFILGSYAGNTQRENFIEEGNDTFDESDVQLYEFNFGSNWRGPVGSNVCINFRFDETAILPFEEPKRSFRYFPPGETTSIPLTLALVPLDFLDDPLVFPVVQDDPRICANIIKRAPINQICIRGDSSCNGVYEYQLFVGTRFDFARTNIEYIGGSSPNLVESSEVLIPAANTLYGKLGATFLVGVEGTETVLINATDFQGEPRGSILWYFRAGGSGAETLLPDSLAGVTITDAGDGQSILRVSGVNAAHVGEYIVVATNEHGEDRASAFISRDICDWIMNPWGECSDPTCHRGRRNRQVLCECNGLERPDSECTLRPKPKTKNRCGPLGVRCNRPCQWKVYDLGSCSQTCGGDSYRERNVECVDLVTDNRVNEDCCNVLFKPEKRLSCDVPDCSDCIDLMSQLDCEAFVDFAGNCDSSPYCVLQSCCATCRRRGL